MATSGVLGLYQQFTTERDALKRAINRLSVRERQATSSADMPHITPYQAELIDQNDPEALELAVQELVRELNIRRDQAVPIAQGKARSIIAENTNVTVATLSTLENVVRGLRELPGRKVMVLLSDGFLLGGLRSGRHFDVRRITDAATRAGVVIYSLDVRGLIAVPATMDASQPGSIMGGALAGARSRIENSGVEAQRDGLHALARDTGGLPLFNNNDINLGLQRVLDDTETYYLLAFEPSVSYRDGRYRKLEIKLVNRPGLKIRTRSGYFSPDDKAAEKENRALAKAAEKDKEKATEKNKKPIAESKTVTPRAASLPGDGGGKPLPGGGGGVGAILEEATVTVTGRFSGGAEALNVLREFEPPALNPTGELRPRSGAGNGDVQITKLIELAKSPRAAQCPKGRDCFEVQTGNRDFTGNGGFNVNLEVLYADGTRKTAAAALTAPGRPLVLSVDKPAAAFTSVKVRIRGNGDGVFTRSATRNELLAT